MQPGDALHRGGLASAVRPDDAEDLTLADRERHILHGDHGAVGLAQAIHRDDRPWRRRARDARTLLRHLLRQRCNTGHASRSNSHALLPVPTPSSQCDHGVRPDQLPMSFTLSVQSRAPALAAAEVTRRRDFSVFPGRSPSPLCGGAAARLADGRGPPGLGRRLLELDPRSGQRQPGSSPPSSPMISARPGACYVGPTLSPTRMVDLRAAHDPSRASTTRTESAGRVMN